MKTHYISSVLAGFVLALAAVAPARAGGDCGGTATGRETLIDLPPELYLEAEGGLYPGQSNALPAEHERDADRTARVMLLDAGGVPDAAAGRIVLLSIGMSNTTIEFRRFVSLAGASPLRNQAVVLVDGAQGGWSAERLSDPQQSGPYWDTVQSRLTAAGVSAAQVQAFWLKEANASPHMDFPADAQKLKDDLADIVLEIHSRFPNARQLYLSSRIYAGYAATPLSPEPFAYQSAFAVKWLVQSQIESDPLLNFDPSRGPAEAPWMAWGPYLWADGLRPRSDGLIWECDDFQDDGTHPSEKGAQKVAEKLLAFFMGDGLASRWFADCDPAAAGAFAIPPEVLGVRVESTGVAGDLYWEDLGPVAGPAVQYEVVHGNLDDLRFAGDFSGSGCLLAQTLSPSASLQEPDPAPGEAQYFLVRGLNACGAGSFGEDLPGLEARSWLDAESPCL